MKEKYISLNSVVKKSVNWLVEKFQCRRKLGPFLSLTQAKSVQKYVNEENQLFG